MGFSSSRKGIDNSLGPTILLGPEKKWFKFPIQLTCRGDERKAIVKEDRERSVFLEKLEGSLAIY